MFSDNKILVPVIICALAFIIGLSIISNGIRDIKKADETITVTGSAKKDIVSDLGFINGAITAFAVNEKEAYQLLEKQRPAVTSFFEGKGFKKENIVYGNISSNPRYESISQSQGTTVNRLVGYEYYQQVRIESNKVYDVSSAAIDAASLIMQDINFVIHSTEYYYTKLADIKVEIQAEAAKDALIRAERIADATDKSIGNIRSARMGVLQITPKFSNAISDMGINDVSSIEKEITAVVTASFDIK